MRRFFLFSFIVILALSACAPQRDSRVVFTVYRDTFGFQNISENAVILNTNGTDSLLLDNASGFAQFSDGQIIYSAPGNQENNQGNHDLWIAGSFGGSPVNLTNTRMLNEVNPKPSPDEKLIAYIEGIANGELCFIKPDGTDGWCLRSNSFVYTYNCSLYGQQPSGGCLTFETGLQISAYNIQWSPVSTNGEYDLIVESNWYGEGNKIWRVHLIDGLLTNISLIAIDAVHPAFRSDGTLTYVNYETESVHKVNLNGSGDELLFPGYASDIAWSPDGQKMAFSLYEDDVYNLYVSDASGNIRSKVAEGYDPVWSPDGSELLFVKSAENRNDLYKLDASGQEILLHENGEHEFIFNAMFLK